MTDDLRTADQVDAALAALTGILALRGSFIAPGDPDEGLIVLPVIDLPTRPYPRAAREILPEPQPALPGFRPCRCGDPQCAALTSREFAPGHDAKRKSILWQVARYGNEAVRELGERNWLLPTEMR